MIWYVLLTYILASIFAIAGMGAAGVLIPNYISLGMSVRVAMLMGLTQNTAELTFATGLNHMKKLVKWREVSKVLLPAVLLIPVGAYINMHIPRIFVLASFAIFLLFALYRMLISSKLKAAYSYLIPLLGALEGFTAGLIGMDAAPIAIIAFSYMFESSKDISANTAAAALGGVFCDTRCLCCIPSRGVCGVESSGCSCHCRVTWRYNRSFSDAQNQQEVRALYHDWNTLHSIFGNIRQNISIQREHASLLWLSYFSNGGPCIFGGSWNFQKN